MKFLGSTLVFHLFQIAMIYLPGAALIPVVLIASFYSVTHAIVAAVGLLFVIAAGFLLRPRVAEQLGLNRDYE